MLICLVGIPLAAVFGTSLPEVFKAVLAGQETEPDATDEPPAFVPTGPPAVSLARSSDRAQSDRQGIRNLGESLPHQKGVISTGYRAPAESTATEHVDTPLLAGSSSASHREGIPAGSGRSLAPPPRLPYAQRTPPHRTSPATGESRQGPSADELTQMQHRLRQLGATYLLLEYEASRQPSYRFFCKMAIGGSASHVQTFEARAADPLGAIRRVLQQVEIWRNQRR
jgi:hypothetical protein